jgi:hypothetical protein
MITLLPTFRLVHLLEMLEKPSKDIHRPTEADFTAGRKSEDIY